VTNRVLIIGAGPIGIAAALGCLRRGLDTTVLEQGEVGESLRRWGPTRFFSPLGMNVPPQFRMILNGSHPQDDALLTGPELADLLSSVASQPPLSGHVLTRHRVTAIGRRGLAKMDFAGHPLRSERPFRLLADTPEGERIFEAERVLDASGGFVFPTPYGPGALPPLGSGTLDSSAIRDLGSLHGELDALRGRHVLLIGHGHSAANALLALQDHRALVTWAVRTANRRPCSEVANDPLPERQSVVSRANDLAEKPPDWLSVLRRTSVESVSADAERVRVTFTNGDSGSFDRIVALTGYRPDNSFLSELNIELSPVTEGNARLSRAIGSVTDCLSAPTVRREDLETGEPGFYMIGSKSYGRSRTFLLRNGLQQLASILEDL
jgi:hypothetical protein